MVAQAVIPLNGVSQPSAERVLNGFALFGGTYKLSVLPGNYRSHTAYGLRTHTNLVAQNGEPSSFIQGLQCSRKRSYRSGRTFEECEVEVEEIDRHGHTRV